jgi:hypothetical protein
MTFEGGLRDPSTGVDSISGTVLLEAATPIHGTASARVANASGYLQESFPATADAYVTMRVRIVSLPSGSPRFVMLSNGGTTVGNLTLTSAGRLRLRNGSTAIGSESAPLVAGNTYLIGLRQARGTGNDAILEAFVAPDGGTFGPAFARLTTGTWTSSADRIRFGATNNSAVNVMIDDVLVADGGQPAPIAMSSTIVLAAAAPGSSYAFASVDRRLSGTAIGPGYLYSCPVTTVA